MMVNLYRTNLSTFYEKANIVRLRDQVQLSLLKFHLDILLISYQYLQVTNLFDLQNHNYNTRNRNNVRDSSEFLVKGGRGGTRF